MATHLENIEKDIMVGLGSPIMNLGSDWVKYDSANPDKEAG